MTLQAPAPDTRIVTIDFIRGCAVMLILLANLPAFALPESAYFSPLSWGGSTGLDRIAWFANFVLVEGKMRGLFSFLFGASMLLVMDRATAAGDDPAAVHFRRMSVLFVIGCLHLYLLWWGDILSHYALVGCIAFMFRRLPVRWLVGIGVALVALELVSNGIALTILLDSFGRDTAARIATWNGFADFFGVPPPAEIGAEIAALRGDYASGLAWRWDHATNPLTMLPVTGPETLGYMVFGMAALRSGCLTGAWPRARYRRWMTTALGLSLPCYTVLAFATIAHGFDQRWVFFASMVAAVPLRPVMFIGYACLLMLAMRQDGRLSRRIAAVGRVALTNYLGTTVLMTFVFDGWGLGQFARWPRAALYCLPPVVWLIMLAWSAPWLARYRYGPVEWLWRCASRFARQPLRRRQKCDEPFMADASHPH